MKPTFTSGSPLQDRCRGHSAQMTMDGRHVLVPDLGADKVWAFSLGPGGTMRPCAAPFWQAEGGYGPRHMAAHPNGRWLYLICEMAFADRGIVVIFMGVISSPRNFAQQVEGMIF